MKRAFSIIVSALACVVAMAQTPEDYHFSVRDNYVTWQLVYETSIDTDAALDYLLGSGNFADVSEVSGGLSFTILPRMVDFRASGAQRGNVPMYILNHPMTAHGLLQIREGRYRVTVDHVLFQDEPSPVPIETYALNRQHEFRSIFTASGSNAGFVLNCEFTNLFTVPTEVVEEEW